MKKEVTKRFVSWALLEEQSPLPTKYYVVDSLTNKIVLIDNKPSTVDELVKELNEAEEKITKIVLGG